MGRTSYPLKQTLGSPSSVSETGVLVDAVPEHPLPFRLPSLPRYRWVPDQDPRSRRPLPRWGHITRFMAGFNKVEHHHCFSTMEQTVSHVSNSPCCPGSRLISPVLFLRASMPRHGRQGVVARWSTPQLYAILLTPEDKGRNGMVEFKRGRKLELS